jgi:thiol:disulfide interchange protein DsbD
MNSINEFLSHALSGGSLWVALPLAYLGGVLTSLTPCVYPMIPITVSVVGGAQSESGERSFKKVAFRAFLYIFGMAITYAFLGVVAGLTGKVFGTFTNTPGWYFALAIILNIAALAMMDVLPFDPQLWWNHLKPKLGFPPSRAPVHHGELAPFSVFALGASSGLIAAPCTTPVLTSILAFIARSQSVIFGLSLMLAFALGLGTLLLVIAIFAGSLELLPRSGMWMKRIKVGSGILLLGFAEYLMFRAGALGGF